MDSIRFDVWGRTNRVIPAAAVCFVVVAALVAPLPANACSTFMLQHGNELPRLMHANWMQFVLDNSASLDDAINSTNEVVLDGWTWHYFLGDADGNTATLAFIDGEVVVHRGASMPVPGLFNTPYDREMDILEYFDGFGGEYQPDLEDPEVPRFVKTAVMVRDYDPATDAVDYGLWMLDTLKVLDVPEWSILIDARRRDVYFKTRINPAVKRFSMNSIDFSNRGPTLVLDMDFESAEGASDLEKPPSGVGFDVGDRLQPMSTEDVRGLLTAVTEMPGIPQEFFTGGGLTVGEFIDRFAGHHLRAATTAAPPARCACHPDQPARAFSAAS